MREHRSGGTMVNQGIPFVGEKGFYPNWAKGSARWIFQRTLVSVRGMLEGFAELAALDVAVPNQVCRLGSRASWARELVRHRGIASGAGTRPRAACLGSPEMLRRQLQPSLSSGSSGCFESLPQSVILRPCFRVSPGNLGGSGGTFWNARIDSTLRASCLLCALTSLRGVAESDLGNAARWSRPPLIVGST